MKTIKLFYCLLFVFITTYAVTYDFIGYSERPIKIKSITVPFDTKFTFSVIYKGDNRIIKKDYTVESKRIVFKTKIDTNGYDNVGNHYKIRNAVLTYSNKKDNNKIYLINSDSTNYMTANRAFVLGERAFRSHDYDSALHCFSKILELYPDNKKCKNKVEKLSYLRIKQLCLDKDYENAFKIISTMPLNREKSIYHSSLGKINLGYENYIEATCNFNDAIIKDNKNISAWWGLGLCLFNDGLEAEACTVWKKGARLDTFANDCITQLQLHCME